MKESVSEKFRKMEYISFMFLDLSILMRMVLRAFSVRIRIEQRSESLDWMSGLEESWLVSKNI